MEFLRLTAMLALLFFTSFNALALDVCTVTINSNDEKNVLKSYYKEARFTELVPESKDPDWLDKACQAGTHCDVLLISGHFGGLFFGEKSSSILSLDHLQDLSCQNKCPGILGAKKVMLMGCNTLATKKPDHRSIEKYISVLVQDGFPQNLAEDVVSARYSDFGLSMSQRMAVAFPQAESIYGFESTSPLGIENGPNLKKALENQKTSLDEAMKKYFAATSFKLMKPQTEISALVLKNSCGLRQIQNWTQRHQTYEDILRRSDYALYFDQLIKNRDDLSLRQTWNQLEDSKLSQNLKTFSDHVISEASIMIGLQLKVTKLQKNLNLISDENYKTKAYDLIQTRLRSGLDYIALDQLCTVAQEFPELTFQSQWFDHSRKSELSYYAHLAGCFSQMNRAVQDYLVKISLDINSTPSLVRESLRTLESKWTTDQKLQLSSQLAQARGSVRSELIASLGLKRSNLAMQACMKSVVASQASERDNQRWTCFNQNSKSLASIQECQTAANEFETEAGSGAQWHCLQNFPEDLSITNCIQASRSVKDLEKSDDFLLGCWQQIKKNDVSPVNRMNKSECLRISESLKIYGHRIKQNWNCVSSIQD